MRHFGRDEIFALDPRRVADALAEGLAAVARGDAIAPANTQPVKGYGQLFGAGGQIAVGVAVNGSVRKAGDDRLVPEQRFRPSQNGRKRQLIIHHKSSHGSGVFR